MVLAACTSSELSINEIQNIPSKVQQVIFSDLRLQIIYNGEKGAYIVFHTQGTVTAELELTGNMLNIKLENESQSNDELKQHVFKVSYGDSQHDTINIIVNGQETYFDMATGI